MTTVKSYTDIEQSKKLAEILPLESADMYYEKGIGDNYRIDFGNYADISISKNLLHVDAIPCWSLTALLDIVKTYSSRLEIALRADKNYNIFAVSGDFVFRSFDKCPEGYDNPIDACYELILKLNELKIKKNG